jgi:hypothetical protein
MYVVHANEGNLADAPIDMSRTNDVLGNIAESREATQYTTSMIHNRAQAGSAMSLIENLALGADVITAPGRECAEIGQMQMLSKAFAKGILDLVAGVWPSAYDIVAHKIHANTEELKEKLRNAVTHTGSCDEWWRAVNNALKAYVVGLGNVARAVNRSGNVRDLTTCSRSIELKLVSDSDSLEWDCGRVVQHRHLAYDAVEKQIRMFQEIPWCDGGLSLRTVYTNTAIVNVVKATKHDPKICQNAVNNFQAAGEELETLVYEYITPSGNDGVGRKIGNWFKNLGTTCKVKLKALKMNSCLKKIREGSK